MRKLVVLLLIAGIVLGMMAVAESMSGESSLSSTDSLYDIIQEEGENPTPCGGGGGGAGGGAPG